MLKAGEVCLFLTPLELERAKAGVGKSKGGVRIMPEEAVIPAAAAPSPPLS